MNPSTAFALVALVAGFLVATVVYTVGEFIVRTVHVVRVIRAERARARRARARQARKVARAIQLDAAIRTPGGMSSIRESRSAYDAHASLMHANAEREAIRARASATLGHTLYKATSAALVASDEARATLRATRSPYQH